MPPLSLTSKPTYWVRASSAVSSLPVPRTSGSCSPSLETSMPYLRRIVSLVVGTLMMNQSISLMPV